MDILNSLIEHVGFKKLTEIFIKYLKGIILGLILGLIFIILFISPFYISKHEHNVELYKNDDAYAKRNSKAKIIDTVYLFERDETKFKKVIEENKDLCNKINKSIEFETNVIKDIKNSNVSKEIKRKLENLHQRRILNHSVYSVYLNIYTNGLSTESFEKTKQEILKIDQEIDEEFKRYRK